MKRARFVGVGALLFLLLFSACATDRYVGSVGTTGVYTNRGFGFVLDLKRSEILARWRPLDPAEMSDIPPSLRVAEVVGPIDIDGDGVLRDHETVRYMRPTLRLVARTATPSATQDPKLSPATIDVEVVVLGGRDKAADLDVLARRIAEERLKKAAPQDAGPTERATTRGGFPVSVLERNRPPDAYLIALIDHAGFVAENSIVRRQGVVVTLRAPIVSSAMRADFHRVLNAIALNARAGETTYKEQW